MKESDGETKKGMNNNINFDEFYKGMRKSSLVIENFINSRSDDRKCGKVFKVLVELYNLFKSEFDTGINLRNVVYKQKQEILSLKTEVTGFTELFSHIANRKISSLSEARIFAFENHNDISSIHALEQTQTELIVERTHLKTENEEMHKKVDDLRESLNTLENKYKNITSKLKTKLEMEKGNNLVLKNENKVLITSENSLLKEIANLLGLKNSSDKATILQRLYSQNIGSKTGNSSIKTAMIVIIFCVRISGSINNNNNKKNLHQLKLMGNEEQQVKAKIELLKKW